MNETLDKEYYVQHLTVGAHDRAGFPDTNSATNNNAFFTLDVPNNFTMFSNLVAAQPVFVHMPNVFYNVPTDQDDKSLVIQFKLPAEGTPLSIEIGSLFTKGQYLIDDIASQIQTAFQTTTETYNGGFNNYSDLFTDLVVEIGQTSRRLEFYFSTYPAALNDIAWTIEYVGMATENNTLHTPYEHLLNYKIGGSRVTDGTYAERLNGAVTERWKYTWPFSPKLAGPGTCAIHCPQLTNNSLDLGVSNRSFDVKNTAGQKRGSPDTFCEVPLNVPWGQIAFYESKDPGANIFSLTENLGGHVVSRLEFSLRDLEGNTLDIHDHDWYITIKLWSVSRR